MANNIAEEIDPEQLVEDLIRVFDSIKADFKPAPVTVKEEDRDDVVLEDNSNVISSCKKHLINLLKPATEEVGQCWSTDQLLLNTLPNHLVTISHVITGWPPSCPMPNEMSKQEKGKQGSKELGSKDGCVLLNTLQNHQLKGVKTTFKKFEEEIAIITTADLTTNDSLMMTKDSKPSQTKHVAANNETEDDSATVKKATSKPLLPPAPSKQHSQKKHVTIVSDKTNIDMPTARKDDKPSGTRHLATVSSKTADDANLLPSLSLNKQPSQKRHVVIVSSEMDIDIPMNKSLLNQKKPVTITSTDSEGDKVLFDSKHCRLSPPDASEDPIGSNNNYKEG
ncbi:hypothetical protein C0989_006394 [Termitomyces sp. Mn162]|nr:hypothetical protein C0989_006394 [Termitomyces sp. Mn162]